MKFVIVGAGAVGTYFGCRLAEGGHEVAFYVRKERLTELMNSGMTVRSEHGDFTLSKPVLVTSPEGVGRVDVILICTKSFSLPSLASTISRLGSQSRLVLPLLNGVGHWAFLSSFVPETKLLNGLCLVLADLLRPGLVRQQGLTPRVVFGRPGKKLQQDLVELQNVFSACTGVKGLASDDIVTEVWRKCMSVTALGVVGAVTRLPLGITRSVPGTRQMMEDCMKEIAQVARSEGALLSDEVVQQTMKNRDAFPANTTTSMQRDLMNGRPSELDAQLGEVLRSAEKAGISIPTCKFLYEVLKPQDMLATGELEVVMN